MIRSRMASARSSTMLTDCNSLVTVCASKTGPKPSPLDPMQPVIERSHPTSGRPATPADINRNNWPTSIGMPGRHHRNAHKARDPEMHQTKKGNQWYFGMEGNYSLFLLGCTYTQAPYRRHGSIGYAATYTQILRAIGAGARYPMAA